MQKTKKKVPRRLDLFERIDECISSYPHLQTTTSDDAVVEVRMHNHIPSFSLYLTNCFRLLVVKGLIVF
ncbi:hypothetical protein FRX31_029974 [Thalictrum thalictroides]|uniref:Uncharacterized protein n=1 Tax=Thalictrum thalictroides TaxID=46969 RepID=A0A7J6V5T6_THATH|nr:hypothetical protein FRX31_029974 [Thalictrum thalictroides]